MSPSGSLRPRYPRGGLHGHIVHAIGRQILSGQIRPGEQLPSLPGFPASRTVLREVIKVLAAKGLVESRPKTGTRVRPRSAWNLLDPDVLAWMLAGVAPGSFLGKVTEVRLIVEPAAAELAARRADETQIQTIEEAYRDMEAMLGGDGEDYVAFNEADMRFHKGIMAACGNDLLEQMSQVVFSALVLSFEATSRMLGRARATLPEHRAILNAIRRRQPRRAGQAMRHLVEVTAREVERLREPGQPR